jgi:transglutaminase-like putative cysteine protease
MKRRDFIKTAAILPAAAAAPVFSGNVFAAPGEGRRWRTFEVTTSVEVQQPAGVTRVWLPLPLAGDTEYQRNFGSVWSAPGGVATTATDGRYGAAILSAEWPGSVRKPTLQLTTRFATRDWSVDTGATGSRTADRAELQRYLAPTELIPTDGIVRETARDITRNVRGGDVEKARAIYEWIVENTFRDPATPGCGLGDIKWMLESGNLGGKCADLNALFVGLARSIGIPARDVYGVRVAKSEYGYRSLGAGTDNITKAQHCRAEFHSAACGWVPVDPADVRKVVLEEEPNRKLALNDERVARARARLFGSWEMNWLAFNTAHDVALPSAPRGTVPFFMYPQCDTAGGRVNCLEPENFRYQMTAREITVA